MVEEYNMASLLLHFLISHNRRILNVIHVDVACNVTNRKTHCTSVPEWRLYNTRTFDRMMVIFNVSVIASVYVYAK